MTMPAPHSATLCRVCKERAAAYTCPRCNARYCSVDCYKRHSERCTEGFYRESTVQELRSITATQDEKQRMLEILQRLHEQELEDDSASSSSSSRGQGDDAALAGGGLSDATLHRLLAKMQASGGELEVTEADLSPAELAAFHRAVAAGELAGVVAAWQPWWLSQEAAVLELGSAGTALVVAEGDEEDKPGAAAPSSTGLPAPPSKPLPPLAALTRAPPSPVLQHHLLDLVYAYCYTLRLYNGDYRPAAVEAADTLFALSSVLAASGAAPSSTSSSSSSSPTSDLTAASVLLSCISRACQLPVGSREHRAFAVGVLADVAALLEHGRSCIILALMDLTRLVEAAKQQQEQEGQEASSSGVATSGRSSSLARQPLRSKAEQRALARMLVAAQRKLLFFLSWANEQPDECWGMLQLAVSAEQEKHAASLGQAGRAGGAVELHGGRGLQQQPGQHATRPSRPAAPPVIEELL